MFSGKTPIAKSAMLAKTKVKAPILPAICFFRYTSSPVANMMHNAPLMSNPELKSTDVAPSTMPKSLRALSVQLNSGHVAIAAKMSVNAMVGVRKPQIPDTLSHSVSLSFAIFPSFMRFTSGLSLKICLFGDKPPEPL